MSGSANPHGGANPTDTTPGLGSAPGFGGGFGGGQGGLASSPNVPRPGASIDPATGKPFAAGLTRAELVAKREAEAAEAAAKK
jgi:hypothetical protein